MAPEVAVAVVDIGITHAKLLIIDGESNIIDRQQTATPSRDDTPYLAIDTSAIWAWLVDALAAASGRAKICAIVPCAHGSAAVLLNGTTEDAGLALPVLHYEASIPTEVAAAYTLVTPDFSEVLAPVNPGGLTLARQLFWQQTIYPAAFAQVRQILCYSQYWAWQLCGVASNEVTSLGAQTHLWAPQQRAYSSLIKRRRWTELFAPLRPAWQRLGRIKPALAHTTGLSPSTEVICGIHDSSANYLRYQSANLGKFSLMSTGTWIINFNAEFPADQLAAKLDTNTNSDISGAPISCSRFMGGREFHALGGSDQPRDALMQALNAIIEASIFALPSFTDSGGPWPETGGLGRIINSTGETSRTEGLATPALATLYCALMAHTSLAHIGTDNRIIIDGNFASNGLFCDLIATLNRPREVAIATQTDGTALGAALLAKSPNRPPANAAVGLRVIEPKPFPGLKKYTAQWKVKSSQQSKLR